MPGLPHRFVPLYWIAIVVLGLIILFQVPLMDMRVAAQTLKEDQVITVPNSNRAMATAIGRARATLPEFFKNFTEPHAGKDQFSLKVAIKDGAEVEHMWLMDLKQENAQWSGVINNIPRMVSNVQMGQRLTIAHKDISDWMYMEGGKIYGGYTIRVLAEMLSPEEAALLKSALAYKPE